VPALLTALATAADAISALLTGQLVAAVYDRRTVFPNAGAYTTAATMGPTVIVNLDEDDAERCRSSARTAREGGPGGRLGE